MRHWKFKSNTFDKATVLAYMNEAIENQKKELRIMPEKSKTVKAEIPDLLRSELEKIPNLMEAFNVFLHYKQRNFCEYIANVKQIKTKLARLTKIIPMINQDVGLND